MLPATIAAQLPNGFHDAAPRVARRRRRAGGQARFEFWVGDLDADTEEGREAMRPGALRLTGLTAMLVDPPATGYEFAMDDGVTVDSDFGVYPGEPEAPEDVLVRLWFYSSTWNSRMMFMAKGCELEWAP